MDLQLLLYVLYEQEQCIGVIVRNVPGPRQDQPLPLLSVDRGREAHLINS